jgi:hypothetical protein
MRRALFAAIAAAVPACALFPELGGLTTGGDDGSVDAPSIDAPSVDAPSDSSLDAAGSNDAPLDSPGDAGDAAVGPIANVQIGPVVAASTGGKVTVTLANATAAGDLLVATVACDSGAVTLSNGGGLTQAILAGTSTACAAIFYRVGVAQGITSVEFDSSNGGALVGQLSEWSGVTALDATGSVTATSGTYQLIVSASGSLAAPGEVAVTAFGQSTANASTPTYTAGSGWTNLGSTASTQTHYTGDYILGVGPGALSETETGSLKTIWAGTIATFR